jgi:prolipoprotein diacylglyceryl transferase
VTLAAIPSPTTAVWELGPVPIRAYAIFIVLGIVIACVVTEHRLRQRGVPPYAVLDLALWAVPFGIVGARIYHVVTTPQPYFGANGDLLRIVAIWEGGLGIWGAIAGGGVGVWLCCRYQLKIPFLVVADAAAVGIPLAQAVGRLGNWFNNELYGGRADDLPWGLRVYQMTNGQVERGIDGEPVALEGLYHPTFLYEALWNIGVAILVWQVGKRLRLGHGRQFALYVAAYTAGRFWIEMLRIDGEAEGTVTIVLGARINVWVSVLVFLAALAYLLRVRGEPEYLLPAGEGVPLEGGEGFEAPAPADGYRVVTEQEYRAARLAGDAEADDTEAGDGDAGDGDAGDGEPGEAEPGEAEPEEAEPTEPAARRDET